MIILLAATRAVGDPMGICLHAYSPETPSDKIECFEFEKYERSERGYLFFVDVNKRTLVTPYQYRGVIQYKAGLSPGDPEFDKHLQVLVESENLYPATRRFLTPKISDMRAQSVAYMAELERVKNLPQLEIAGRNYIDPQYKSIEDGKLLLSHKDGFVRIAIEKINEAELIALAKLDPKAADIKILTIANNSLWNPVYQGIANGVATITHVKGVLALDLITLPESDLKLIARFETDFREKKAIASNGEAAKVDPSTASGKVDATVVYAELYLLRGMKYAQGDGIAKNPEEAFKCFRKAALMGNAAAMYQLGTFYSNGNEVPKDSKEAAMWYRKAAQMGIPDAMYELGVFYSEGKGVLQDVDMAFELYRNAAEKGHTNAMLKLAISYDLGKGVTIDRKVAFEYYRKAAENGHPDAMHQLGMYYYLGDSVSKDLSEAAKWFRKAAEKGHIDALYQVGRCYFNGEGASQNYAEAVKCYTKAAEHGHADAMTQLGVCYFHGHGITADQKEAVKWYGQAAEKGGLSAMTLLGICYYDGTGVVKDYEQAFKWFLKAAEQGDGLAQLSLGECYARGNGVVKDPLEAYMWTNLAAGTGLESAKKSLQALEAGMTRPQLAEAKKRVDQRKPK